MDCAPRFATRRRPERDTLGPRVAAIAERLGTPLMPWQRLVADVGMEVAEVTKSGLVIPAYREVVVSVPRQNGKTTIVLSWEIDRAVNFGRAQLIAYTAQTGQDGRKKLLYDQVPMIERSPLKPLIANVRKKNGEEGVDFIGGSQLDVLAGGVASGHGRTRGLGVIDEAFDDTDDRREQAIVPSMATVADAQLFVCSTMGTESSLYFNRKVDTGRDIALADRDDSEVAYFEWSALDDDDIADPRTWEACMPAYDYTITERVVRHAYESMSEGEFRRAFLNQRTSSDERVIPLDVWNAANSPSVVPDGGVVFAIDCDPEREWSSIAVADGDGRIELLDHQTGTAWVVPTVARYAKEYGGRVAYDPAGPAGVFGDDLERNGVRPIKVAGQDYAHACAFFFDGIVESKLRVRPHEALNVAVAAATRRISGDAWTWARRGTRADISPLVAVSLASWAAVFARKPTFLY